MRSVADQVNALGIFDAIIHNAAVFAINSLSPYVLTALIHPPRRLTYVSSELHKQGEPSLSDLNWTERSTGLPRLEAPQRSAGVCHGRRLPGVPCNAMTPGWVQT
jgi:hypothetical protein